MQLIEFKDSFSKEEYILLRKKVDWVSLDDNQINNIIKNSEYKISIIYNNNLAGIARCITDDGYIYLLCDIIIDPKYQGKGLGRIMLDEFINRLKNKINNNYAKFYIMSLKGKEGFYKSLGFSEEYATGLTIVNEVN